MTDDVHNMELLLVLGAPKFCQALSVRDDSKTLYGSPPKIFFTEMVGFETSFGPYLLKYGDPYVIVRYYYY